jgi:hypothetical protein
VTAGNDDPYNAYEMSLYDQQQKQGLTVGKWSSILSTSKEEKSGNSWLDGATFSVWKYSFQ